MALLTALGRVYTTLSLAAPAVAVGVVLALLLSFEEHGAQSQGLGALVVIAGATMLGLALNALVAGLLGWRVPAVRARLAHVAVCVGVGLAGLGLVALFG